jgi:DNA topoisomerase-1
VDVENDFAPRYRVPNEKREVVKSLKKEASEAEEVFLATDPDREGEAIAWHLLEAADIEPERARRVIFHEITKPAIEEAFQQPRTIDMNLVDAQQARRVLDRLVGYNLSPLLWAKVRSRLSAGRVQSVALRLVVEREREIQNFVATEFWSIEAEFLQPDKPPAFRAALVKIDGETPELGSEQQVQPIVEDMRTASYRVSNVRRGSRMRRPSPPFITSTLQQEASRRLGFSARRTMAVAQQLYEGIELGQGEPVGLITYMRTDSTQVSAQAQAEARRVIKERFGEAFLPEAAPVYRKKGRGAQEAHEAIRPTACARSPEDLKPFLSSQQFKLYGLIWRRFVASQMKPAEYDTLAVNIEGQSVEHGYRLRVTASRLRFAGFLQVYGGELDRDNNQKRNQQRDIRMEKLPDLAANDPLDLMGLFPEQHFTQPPRRFSEASLVRALEEHGIGRPSTYAPILSTLQTRGYVERENRRLAPTETGVIVNDLIVEHFPNIVDVNFTARMEGELDEIAGGKLAWVDVVRAFYQPFAEQVARAQVLMPVVKAEPELLERECPECGKPLTIRHGRFGKFIGCSNFPTCRYTEPWLEKIGVRCPKDQGELVIRRTRKGRVFYGCANYPECDFTSWKRPLPKPCPECGGMLVQTGKDRARCVNCDGQAEIPASEDQGDSLA